MAKKVIIAVTIFALCFSVFAGCGKRNDSELTIEGSWKRSDKDSSLYGMVITVEKYEDYYVGRIAELPNGGKDSNFKVGEIKWDNLMNTGAISDGTGDVYEFDDLSINKLDKSRSTYHMKFSYFSNNKDKILTFEKESNSEFQNYKRVKTIPIEEKIVEKSSVSMTPEEFKTSFNVVLSDPGQMILNFDKTDYESGKTLYFYSFSKALSIAVFTSDDSNFIDGVTILLNTKVDKFTEWDAETFGGTSAGAISTIDKKLTKEESMKLLNDLKMNDANAWSDGSRYTVEKNGITYSSSMSDGNWSLTFSL